MGIAPVIGGRGGLTRQETMWKAAGILVESGDPGMYSGTVSPSTQVVQGKLLGLRGGDSVTGIVLRVAVAAAGTLPTTARFGLADSTGKIVVLSGNLNALANWASGPMLFPFTAPYVIPGDAAYFAVWVVNGTWGTTQPTLLRLANSAAGEAGLAGAVPQCFQASAQTDLPALGASSTITVASTLNFYTALY